MPDVVKETPLSPYPLSDWPSRRGASPSSARKRSLLDGVIFASPKPPLRRGGSRRTSRRLSRCRCRRATDKTKAMMMFVTDVANQLKRRRLPSNKQGQRGRLCARDLALSGATAALEPTLLWSYPLSPCKAERLTSGRVPQRARAPQAEASPMRPLGLQCVPAIVCQA